MVDPIQIKAEIYEAIGCSVSGAEEKRRTCHYSG